jgi:TorA maturation chaperone TorD
MTNPKQVAFHLLGHFWLDEVHPGDLSMLANLPELGRTIPETTDAVLKDLAVEFQRLLGFNLPPYESVFIDPSAMLDAPATARVQAFYRQAGWAPPRGLRSGAADHLGLEMLAEADLWGSPFADRLLTAHLALWGPIFCLTLQRLKPHPFYSRLAELTLELCLSNLNMVNSPDGWDPFPVLPPPPVYRGTFDLEPEADEIQGTDLIKRPQGEGLQATLVRLLTPCTAGLYITRQDLANLGMALELPGFVGERRMLLKNLLTLASQYEVLPALFQHLDQLIQQCQMEYAGLADQYPRWGIYARGWCSRLDKTRTYLNMLY